MTAVKNIELFTLFGAGLIAGKSCGLLRSSIPLLRGVKDQGNQKELLNDLRCSSGLDQWVFTLMVSGGLFYLYKKTGDKGFLCPLSIGLLKLPLGYLTKDCPIACCCGE